MGLFDKINGASKAFGENSELLMAIIALMESLAEKDSCAYEYCNKLEKMTKSMNSGQKGVLGMVQMAKGTTEYIGAAGDVHSEKTRSVVNEVLRNQYGIDECFTISEWETITELDFACRIQSKIINYYMFACSNSSDKNLELDKAYLAMSERISLIHMKK